MVRPPRANRLGMYSDVQAILDAALDHSGGSYTLGTPGQAASWRHRANKFRKLYAEMLGPAKQSRYDKIVLPRIAEGSCTVEIKVRTISGTFTPAEGTEHNILDLDAETDTLAEQLRRQIDEGELE